MAEYIEREKLIKDGWHLQRHVYGKDYACIESKDIRDIPTADVRAVVLCRDCKHRFMTPNGWHCPYAGWGIEDDDFCSYGEKREES